MYQAGAMRPDISYVVSKLSWSRDDHWRTFESECCAI
jgi:hypothetical protein